MTIEIGITVNFILRLIVIAQLVLLTACGGGGGGSVSSSPAPAAEDLNDIYPYRSASPYAGVIKACAQAETTNETCLLADLPLLLDDAERPTVDDIMSRVLVSHSWMGLRFQQALETMPDELLRLFAAVTTIVIDDDVRPSSYQAQTSTIFLDPAFLWLTNDEKAVIDKSPDYRSGYSDALRFDSLARYVEGFNYAWDYYSLNDSQQRSLADIRLSLANLLLHELMHANDYFPAEYAAYLPPSDTIYQAYLSLGDQRISSYLEQVMPLESELLDDLGAVMYLGDKETSQQVQLTALDVGAAMAADGASDDYAYASPREDAAMLFAETMMKYLFDLDRDIGYAARPADSAFCDDYIIEWGMRGRIAADNVKLRAQLVVEAVYTDIDFSSFFQNLPAPKMMRAGASWCDNLALF